HMAKYPISGYPPAVTGWTGVTVKQMMMAGAALLMAVALGGCGDDREIAALEAEVDSAWRMVELNTTKLIVTDDSEDYGPLLDRYWDARDRLCERAPSHDYCAYLEE